MKLWAELSTLTAFPSTVLSIVFCHPPKTRPKPEPGWWQLRVHLEDSSLFCIHKGENSTFCLTDVFILCENCLQLLVVKKPMPNQNFKLKPLENKLSWGLYLSWLVTDGFLSTSDFRDFDRKSIQLPRVSWGRGSELRATGNLCPGFSWVVPEAVVLLPVHRRGRPRGEAESAWPLESNHSASRVTSFKMVSVGLWIYFLVYKMEIIPPFW